MISISFSKQGKAVYLMGLWNAMAYSEFRRRNDMLKIKLLGISGSPRKMGNSHFLLGKALAAAKNAMPEEVLIESYSISGKDISGCIACNRCKDLGGCAIEDDFQELRNKWLGADAIIYSVPVYQMGLPGQLKCFIDRLGHSSFDHRKHLKAIGVIAQGGDLFSGQDQVMVSLILHAVFMGCVPVAGKVYGSHLGAGGWTRLRGCKNSLCSLWEDGEDDAQLTVKAVEDVAASVIQTAAILKAGGIACYDMLDEDGGFHSFLEHLKD
jgi:multimeric flavodoxin WrbA